jgi:glycosyltransferase involved in cell wall biosynthesis
VVRVLRDPALARALGAAGRRKAERYAWSDIAGKLEDLYLELIARRERVPLAS